MLNQLAVQDLLAAQGVIFDARSESEYFEAHIPGSMSLPLLNDAERAEVGTLYKKTGPQAARLRGLEIVKPKLQDFFSAFAGTFEGPLRSQVSVPDRKAFDLAFDRVAAEIMKSQLGEPERNEAEPADGADEDRDGAHDLQPFWIQPAAVTAQPITFYCWRGGARSKSLALFAHSLGFNVRVLTGGHKAFRQHVLKFLEAERYPFKLCTLYGLTGSAKTILIRQWKAEGKPVIDLEALAHHRGSAFGQVGIDEYGRQKDFENNLFWEMAGWARRGAPVVVVEGESRRIGRVQLPENFMKAMLEGLHVQVARTVQERVEHILTDYVKPLPEERLQLEARAALKSIERRLGGDLYKQLLALLDEKNYARFTERLLIEYYDKMYALSRAPQDFYHAVIHGAENWDEVAKLF